MEQQILSVIGRIFILFLKKISGSNNEFLIDHKCVALVEIEQDDNLYKIAVAHNWITRVDELVHWETDQPWDDEIRVSNN